MNLPEIWLKTQVRLSCNHVETDNCLPTARSSRLALVNDSSLYKIGVSSPILASSTFMDLLRARGLRLSNGNGSMPFSTSWTNSIEKVRQEKDYQATMSDGSREKYTLEVEIDKTGLARDCCLLMYVLVSSGSKTQR